MLLKYKKSSLRRHKRKVKILVRNWSFSLYHAKSDDKKWVCGNICATTRIIRMLISALFNNRIFRKHGKGPVKQIFSAFT